MECKRCGEEIQGEPWVVNIGQNQVRFCSERCKCLWELDRRQKAGKAKTEARRARQAEAEEVKAEEAKPERFNALTEAEHVVESIRYEHGENADAVLIALMWTLNNNDEMATAYSVAEESVRKVQAILDSLTPLGEAMLRKRLGE